uniref:DEAD/DEAH box helicase n=1 Tax=Strongyloides papillosus TaxID=174720 RepID=A0A0N5CFN6_STREA
MAVSTVLVNKENCYHEVFYPCDNVYGILGEKPQRELEVNYSLDEFQIRGLLVADKHESMLITAHTSAGKTVVADYIIAMCLDNGKKCFYTTPIKALSNQKFEEFKNKYNSVGMMTGEITVNPNAKFLVMTAEILKEMVCSGASLLKNTGYVIMDEGHFIGNKERGHIWEETIIGLGKNIKLAILSATMPNSSQLAKWIVGIKNEPLHVIGTSKRPIPLEYCIHGSKSGRVIHVKMGDEKVNKTALKTAISQCKLNGRGIQELKDLLQYMMEKERLPVIIYCSSRLNCDTYSELVSSMCFLDEIEKELMNEAINSILSINDDQFKTAVSEIENYKQRMLNGVAVHHSSLMKLTKEFIEDSFASGGIKVIFSTETLAVGLNMPATSVIFTSLFKFDGKKRRAFEKSEFIQMAGRAGRRGLDSQGLVVFSLAETANENLLFELMNTASEDLKSQLNISYSDILYYAEKNNLEGLEKMMELSFKKFQNVNINYETAMYKRMIDLLIYGDFLDNEKKITRKGRIALAGRYSENYLVIGELAMSNWLAYMEQKGVVELFSMLQKSDETGNEEEETKSFHREFLEKNCKMIYEYERKFKIVKHDKQYKSPINTKYATAMREIYGGGLIHEVAKANGMYCGAISKKVTEMRQLFESLVSGKCLRDDIAKLFRSIAYKLREIEKNDVSMLEY